MIERIRSKIADRRQLRLMLTLLALLLLLAVIGVLLYVRVNALLDRYMEVQGEKQAETLAELTHRQFQVELTALYTVASELPEIEGMRANALRAIQDADYEGRIGVQRIDGSPFYGENYSIDEFPCIESAVHGERAMSYCAGKGLMFCVPAFRDENVAFVVYRLYPEDVLYERFGVASYGGSGSTRIEDFAGGIVVDAHPMGAEGQDVFREATVAEGIRTMEQTLYDERSACTFRNSSLGEIMLYSAIIEDSDYHVVGYVPKTVVMEGVQQISYMVILVFALLAGMVLLGGFLLVGLERKSKESDALREAARIAEKSSAAKSRFLANMSHDIRTPMNAIIGFTDLALQDTADRESVGEYLGKIQSSSNNLLALLNDILEMGRLESGSLELSETPCSLPEVLHELETVSASQAEEKKQTLTLALDGVTAPTVWCDRPRLHQVLLNLLSNALKFTPEGGEISLRVLQMESGTAGCARYQFRVKDNGIGMSPEFVPKAFTLFERERTSTATGLQGSGLGLAIVKNIVDAMGGTVRVESVPGQGSEFIVDLDLRAAEAPTPAPETPPEEEISLEGRRILLVDDIEMNREIAAMVLEMSGFEVEQACDGSQAVDMVAAARPGYYDLVLMDIQMPVMNGYEATRAIRALEGPQSAVPIVALSANAFDEDRKASAEAGMNGHLAKPLDPEVLIDTLQCILREEGTP